MTKRKFTPDDVWAMFAETDRRMKETDRRMKEESAKLREDLRKMQKETAAQMKETDRKIFGIDKNIGHHAEQFFQNALAESKTFGGVKYDKMEPNLHYRSGLREIEFDIALINGSSIAIIEVKNRVREDFVKNFACERMKAFRELFPEFKNHKAYLGIAGFSFSKEVLEQAKKYGIGIIKQVGKSMEIEAEKLKAY